MSSGTAALHLALVLLGVGASDDVLVPSLTFVASANAVMYVGARPVFLDSERRSWNLDPELLEKELAARARAGREQPAALVGVDEPEHIVVMDHLKSNQRRQKECPERIQQDIFVELHFNGFYED